MKGLMKILVSVLVLANMQIAAASKKSKTCVPDLKTDAETASFCKIRRNYGQVLVVRENCHVSLCGKGVIRQGTFNNCTAILHRWGKINGAPTYRKGCKKNGKVFCEFKVMNLEEWPEFVQTIDVKLCVKKKSMDYPIAFRYASGIEFFLG